jgi:cyanophycin synthetase
MELVVGIDAGRRVGVITAPGDRRDEDIRELGRLAAGLDHVIVKEDTDLRGREPGEIAGLVRDGLVAGGLSDDEIEVVADELEAVDRGLALLEDRDLVVMLADDVPAVLEHLRVRRSRRRCHDGTGPLGLPIRWRSA